MKKIAIQGTKSFSDYSIFLRGMYSILAKLDGTKQIVIYSAGPANINSMLDGFFNITSDTLKSNGVTTKIVPLPPKEIKNRFSEVDRFLYFCNPKESYTDLCSFFRSKDPDEDPDFVTVWRY